jgi:hypothetical protein
VDPGWYAEYFHEVALALGSQGGDHERFARVLAAVAVDSDRDAVIRDYAVQHLRRVWERSAAEPNLRGTIVASLRRFVRDEPEISGAALLSLHLLESQPAIPGKAAEPAITTKELEHLMHHTLNDGASRRDPRTTMGILRIVGARRMLGLAPDVRQLVSDNSQHALVRMSGIAALADLGQQMDRDFLSSLDQPDPRIIKAVKSALDRLP